MLTERFTKVLLALTALLLTVVHPSVAEPNDGDKAKTEPYSIEQTHDGGNYKVRFTIEGAIGIAASSQSTDYVQLEGHAPPNGTITVTMEWVECNGSERDLQLKMIDVLMGNQVNNGDAERSDDEKLFAKSSTSIDNSLDRVVYTFNCADFRQADPSTNDSVLMVTAFSTVQLGSNVTETHVYLKLTLDGNGRFLIPKRYMQMADIVQGVRFIGVNDAIEIWAVEKTQQPFLPQEEFAAKLKAIMTNGH